jgi:hypothetical protein
MATVSVLSNHEDCALGMGRPGAPSVRAAFTPTESGHLEPLTFPRNSFNAIELAYLSSTDC